MKPEQHAMNFSICILARIVRYISTSIDKNVEISQKKYTYHGN